MPISMRSSLVRVVAVLGGGGARAAGMLAAGGPASADTVACGSTITTSVTLTANVDCTSDTTDNALTIGASGVTVNLNGYKILGPGPSADTVGILDNGYSGLTVENGTITGFYLYSELEGASGSDLTGIVLQHLAFTGTGPSSESDTYGVYGQYLDGAVLHSLTVDDIDEGIELVDSQDSQVTGSKAQGTDVGLYDAGSASDTWSYNTVTGSTYGFADIDDTGDTFSHNKGTDDSWGLYAESSADSAYAANTFSDGEYGIETDYPSGVTLRKNTTDGNGQAGVYIYTDDQSGYSATVAQNTADSNEFGLYSQFPTSGYTNHASSNTKINCYDVRCVKAGPKAGIAAPVHHQPPVIPAPFLPSRE